MFTLYIILLTVYIIFSIIVQVWIIKNDLINQRQKILNSILIWIIPIIWGLIILSLLKSNESKVMKQNPRKNKNFKFSDDWETLTGGG
jgi:hypothetical protein